MSPLAPPPLLRLERTALAAAGLGAVAAVVLAWLSPSAFAPAYRFAAFACLAPATGSLIFTLILRMTGGQWGPALQPFFSAGIALLPWIWLLTIPILFFPHNGMARLASPPEKADLFASHGMLVARAAFYGLVFFAVAGGVAHLLKIRRRGDVTSLRWVAPASLITLVLMLHVLADDWLINLEPHWHSTAFPAVWMAGMTLAGYATALFCAILHGADPNAIGPAKRPFGIDWGNLLLVSMVFWCYVAFAQFLIIWAENLPHENSWYLHRSHGGWLVIIVLLALFHFAVPFVFLLSRRVKRLPSGLARLALLLLGAQFLYLAWMILPAFGPTTPVSLGLAIALFAAGAGLCFNRYLAHARRHREAAA
ncbi:MAG TPA: hypothetical protein VHE13_17005 [Opitutus sp.]|nr:hypothetical protein [Opitutus sp.]